MVAVVPETAALRAACREAAHRLAAAATSWIAVGSDAGGRQTVSADARGSFVGFGADVGAAVVVGLGPHAAGPVDPALPLPLLIAGWLREGLPVTVRGEMVVPEDQRKELLGRHTDHEDGHVGRGIGPDDPGVVLCAVKKSGAD